MSRMTLVDGRGELVVLSPDGEPERFWATVGGMGLTGVIVEATFDLIPITSSLISVDTERASDLDDVMDRMIARDDDYRYSVAWIDSVHPAGRGVLTRGDHAPADWLAGKQAQTPLTFDPKAIATAPGLVPGGLVNPLTMRAFNEAWFRKAPKTRHGELQQIGAFFHPARHRATTGIGCTDRRDSCSTSSRCRTRPAIWCGRRSLPCAPSVRSPR